MLQTGVSVNALLEDNTMCVPTGVVDSRVWSLYITKQGVREGGSTRGGGAVKGVEGFGGQDSPVPSLLGVPRTS